MKSLKLKPSIDTSLIPLQTPLKAIDCEHVDKVDWKRINNIADLTQEIPSIRFYAGDAANKIPSVLRCETCYRLLQHRSSREMSNCPAKVALKGIGKYAGSLSSGLVLSPEKSTCLVEGGNAYWYHSKRNIKQHLVCTGDHSQLHFEALQHEAANKKREARGHKVVNNLIKIALAVLKSKSAAQHFESQLLHTCRLKVILVTLVTQEITLTKFWRQCRCGLIGSLLCFWLSHFSQLVFLLTSL